MHTSMESLDELNKDSIETDYIHLPTIKKN